MFFTAYISILSIVILIVVLGHVFGSIRINKIDKKLQEVKDSHNRHQRLTNVYLEEICKNLNINYEKLNEKAINRIVNDNIVDVNQHKCKG